MAKPLEETQASYIAMYNDNVIFDVLRLGGEKKQKKKETPAGIMVLPLYKVSHIWIVYKYILNSICNLAFLEQIAHLYELNYAPS